MAVRITKSAVNIREKLAELERPVGITGAALMATNTPQEAYNLVGSGRKNIIINGSMVVNQRGFTGTAGTTTNGAYVTDRFLIAHSHDGAVSAGQTSMASGNAFNDGFRNALFFNVTTADASLAAGQFQLLRQPIEGFNVQGIKKGTPNALPVTLSFWVRGTTTGTYIAEIEDNDNGNRSCSQAYTINVANTWEKKVLTYPADTTGAFDNDNALSFYVNWWLAAGSTYSGGTLGTTWNATTANRAVGQTNLLASAANNFWLTGVQLEVGKFATEFERRSYGDELQLCQRYYEKSYDIDIAPGTNIATNGRSAVYFSGTSDTSGNMITHVSFSVPKRSTPTITFYQNSGTLGVWDYNKSGTSGTVSMVTTQHGHRGFCPYANVGGNNISASFNGSWTASSEL